MKHKLIKVTFEYSDTIEILETPDPQKWLDAVNGCVVLSDIHGSPMIKSTWDVQKKSIDKPSERK